MSTMNELLLEIGCEELPAGFVDPPPAEVRAIGNL